MPELPEPSEKAGLHGGDVELRNVHLSPTDSPPSGGADNIVVLESGIFNGLEF